MAASKASLSISSEINPQGGEAEPRSDSRCWGKKREKGERAAHSDKVWETWQACKAVIRREEHINI